jgi:PAS domain S-box-containing protein
MDFPHLTAEQRQILDNLPDPVVIYDALGVIQYVNNAFEKRFGWLRDEVVGTTADFVPRGLRSGLTGVHMILSRRDSYITPDTQRETKMGEIVDVQINTSFLLDAQKNHIGSIIIMRDITERKRVERSEQEHRTFIEALMDVTTALTSTLSYQEVLDLILMNVGRVVPHDLALVDIVDSNGIALTVGCKDYTGEQLEDRVTGITTHVKNLDYLYQMAQTGEYIIVSDFDQKNPPSELAAVTGLRSYIGAPIFNENELIGFVSLQARPNNFFKPSEGIKLQIFAKQAAIAMMNAKRYEQARELAALNERQRLARELHDAVSQTLFSANVTAETILLSEEIPEDLTAPLTRLSQLTRGALAEMRTLLLELRPESLVNADLTELLQHLLYTVSGRKNLNVQLVNEFNGRLPPDIQMACYRIAQETINNIAKHARATQIKVELAGDSERILLSIDDDGVGFNLDEEFGGHFGLQNIRERALEIGADVTIKSELGQGTQVELFWVAN